MRISSLVFAPALAALLAGALPALGDQAPVLALGLGQVERAALDHSPSLKAARLQAGAAGDQSWVAMTGMLPRLSVDGGWTYNTEVPDIQLVPRGPSFPFGDHTNYVVGPKLTWNLWDGGAAFHQWKASRAAEEAQWDQVRSQQRALLLEARMDYFQTQLDLAQVRDLAEDLLLSQSQERDIAERLAAGSSSRIDSLSAQNDVVQKRLALRQARSRLADAMRDLFSLTGLGGGLDPSLPAGLLDADKLPKGISAPTLLLRLDDPRTSQARMAGAESAGLDEDNPRALALHELAQAAQYQADSMGAGHWPRAQVSAQSDLQYPDGPILENVNQNTFAAQVSLPLFSFGQVAHQVAQQEKLSRADAQQEAQARSDLKRDWDKALNDLASLKDQESLESTSVSQTAALEGLVYGSYQNGESTFLDVQAASTRALAAKIQADQTQVQVLIELAILDSLAKH